MRNFHKMQFYKFIVCITISCWCAISAAETLTPEQVLQKVIDHYPSISIAAIEIERARQSIKVVNSQLGWQLGAQAGIEHGVGLFGTASDSVLLGAGMERMLESGSSISLEGNIRREDSDTVFIPTLPNPATSSTIGLSYRQPLEKNTAQSTFQESKLAARQDLETSTAENDELYDQLALKVIDVYFSAAVLLAKKTNINQSIERAIRLQSYIKNKTSLGVTEKKDILQVNAQLDSLLAEKGSLETSWMQQMVAMNRLMERPWDAEIITTYNMGVPIIDSANLFAQATMHSPKIKLMDSRLALADSAIRTRREERKNDIDLVWFAGGQNYKGDTSLGSSSQTELTGGLRLEYKESLDKRGVDAKLYQAQLERNAILQDRKLLMENVHYDLASLFAEIKSNNLALDAYTKSLNSEKIKVDEALQRYRSGRIDTDVLINFEDQLTQAKFSLELQRISLMQRYYRLQVMLGKIWDGIKKPVFHDFISEVENGVEVR